MNGDAKLGFAIEEATIAAIHAAYRAGTATARGVTQAHLDRIAAYDRKGPALGAIIVTNPQALADADALDAHWQKTGTLRGAAWHPGAGERQLRHRRPADDRRIGRDARLGAGKGSDRRA